ncbi:hypothetical protein [Thalassospira alkalitolerans]|uniref:hypothetical protein n=1 Tax=Thalassospira alkalitolerans TaxID=1293890 RepID=UPI003AA9B15E
MAAGFDQRWLIRRGAELLGAVVLIVIICVLYLGFVTTLFAGFTADIQREILSRELDVNSPGDLERIVLQGYHEAQLKDEIRFVRAQIRVLDMNSLAEARRGLALRQDAITAWRAAFDLYAGLGRVLTERASLFEPEFRTAYLTALQAAYAFLAQNDFSSDQKQPSPSVKTADDGRDVMAGLNGALARVAFSAEASGSFIAEINDRIEMTKRAVIAFDEKAVRAQVVWANIIAEQAQSERLRESLGAEMVDLRAELATFWDEEGSGHDDQRRSLVALFQQPLGGVLSLLLQMPGIVLTLLVTVAAGGLGSVVCFIRRYRTAGWDMPGVGVSGHNVFGNDMGEKPDGTVDANAGVGPGPGEGDISGNLMKTRVLNASNAGAKGGMARAVQASDLENGFVATGRLLVMTGEGIAAAIAIFLFTEAGMLMVTQGGPEGSANIEISPFLVTFMAFVSGFMAEDAFSKIQDAGRKIFKIRDDDGPTTTGL